MEQSQTTQPSAAHVATGHTNPAVHLARATLSELGDHVVVPGYDPMTVKEGIVHFGPGNFMKAHLASYINQVLENDPHWGIVVVSRTAGSVSALRKQDGLYALVEREGANRTVSVLAPIVRAIASQDDPADVINTIANPGTRMVTMTISNKGYYLVNTDNLDVDHADVAHDLTGSDSPKTIYGFLAAGLAKRRAESGKPIVVMSLDNVEQNGKTLKKAFLQFIEKTHPDLTDWIAEHVDFPVTLVDRITPESDDEFRTEARQLLGFESSVVVGTERFRQLVVERCRFDIPDWARFGVQMVDDCGEYWQWKFYCLNTVHQVVGITAQRLGVTHVHTAMGHESIANLATRAHIEFGTFLGVDDVNSGYDNYTADIRRRLGDSALNDTVQRVTARTTSKVAERLLSSVERGLAVTQKVLRVPTFVTAAWLLNLGNHDEFDQHINGVDAEAPKLEQVSENVRAWVHACNGTVKGARTRVLRRILKDISKATNYAQFGRLADNHVFVQELAWALVNIDSLGVEQAIQVLLARS